MIYCSFFLLTKFFISCKKTPSFHFCLLIYLAKPCLFKVYICDLLFSTLLPSHFIPTIYLEKCISTFPKPTVPAFTSSNPNKISGPLAELISYSCLKNLVTFGTTDCMSFSNNHIHGFSLNFSIVFFKITSWVFHIIRLSDHCFPRFNMNESSCHRFSFCRFNLMTFVFFPPKSVCLEPLPWSCSWGIHIMPELSSFYSPSRDISHNCNLYACVDLDDLQNLSPPDNCQQLSKLFPSPITGFWECLSLQRSQTQDANWLPYT